MDVEGSRRLRRTAVSVPEDVVLEILVRVKDPAALFRCAVTCWPWKRLVADASFLRRRWLDQDTSCTRTPSTFLTGYIAQKTLVNGHYPLETFFVPTPRSVLGPDFRPLRSFILKDKARLLDHAELLMARHGLLLMRLIPHGAHPVSVLQLAVCDMLKGVCNLLPPLDCNWRVGIKGYAILTSADYSSNSVQQHLDPSGNLAFFKVLIIDNHNIRQPLSLHTFSSQEARWSTPTKCTFDAMSKEGDYLSLSSLEAVVCNGTAHWLVLYGSEEIFHRCILDIDTETYCVSVTRMDIPEKHLYSQYPQGLPQLSVTNDRTLSMFCRQGPGMQVLISTRQNGGKSEGGVSKWVNTRIVELKLPGKTPDEAKIVSLLTLDEKSGKLLTQDTHSNVVYIADLETGSMQKVTDLSDDGWCTRQNGVLLEMAWPAFFASRLGSA